MSVYPGRLSQLIDVQGSINFDQAKTLTDEPNQKGGQQDSGSGNGTTDNFAVAAGVVTLTIAGETWTSALIGAFITISSATTGGNNGTFLIQSVPGGTTLTYINASGAAEVFGGDYEINDPYSLEVEQNIHRTDRRLIKGTTNYYDDVPTYERPSAIGTDVPANLSNIAGKTEDASTRVITVKQDSVKLRPTISGSDLTLAISDETAEFTDMHFVADDVNSFITISGSTDADGSYRIKTVTDGNTLELDGLDSATAEGTISWKLESDLKGILSSRNYADAVDLRGIPVADSGAYDETNYDATFTEVIDPVTGGRPVDEAGNALYARSYGDAKDPNNTTTNEATRFFAQLIYGTNNGSATEEELEPISGRSGSAASVTDSSTTVTGLSGMLSEDIGGYLTVWGCAVDGNQRHAKITAVASATEVTVDGSNFATDGNSGSLLWQVSRHPGNWDFYNGDRYQTNELPETAFRTTLIGGIQADAVLVQDISEIREFIGASDGETTPVLTNTGDEFIFSDLGDPNNTNIEEILNTINAQIGDRTYTGTILNDGETIVESLQALADNITASSITRIIERLTTAIPKNTAHTLPGGATYTLDGGGNGANMFVYWRGVLKNPGSDLRFDHYLETSTTQVTPHFNVRALDDINYFILQ
jgi:hypothetical protein